MKKFGVIFFITMVLAIVGCASSGSSNTAAELPPPPPGTERLYLENGAYAIYRFDLPAGATWGDYDKITAEYMLDEANLKKQYRGVRLMGNYKEDDFSSASSFRYVNLENFNGPYIADNTARRLAETATPDEWFTIEYNLSGSAAHAQFNRANLPGSSDTGPFFFGLGVSGENPGRRLGISQLIRNITLHHISDPELNVVSTGSGFEEPTFALWFDNVSSTRESGN